MGIRSLLFSETGVSLRSPGCPGTHCVNQASLELSEIHCLCTPSAGITGMHHHTQQGYIFIFKQCFHCILICFLSGLLQSPWKKIYQSFLLSIFMMTIKACPRNTICDVLKKWSMMSLKKCGLPTCTKWSYICEEGRKIKRCYTSICIYLLLCRLGEYCQNVYDKLYHCLCLYFF